MTPIGPHAASTASPKPRGNYFCLTGLLLMLAFGSPVLAARSHDCPAEEGKKSLRNLQRFQIEFTATKNDDLAFGHACQVMVRDSAQKK
jgi:hypothetical protein